MTADSFTLAAAQGELVSHDKTATLEKTCRWIERAGDAGADLVALSQTDFPGIRTGGAVSRSPGGRS